jgi:hypothetical protein
MTFYFTYTQKKLTGQPCLPNFKKLTGQPCLQAANFFAFNYNG